MKDAHQIIIRPYITEKTTLSQEQANQVQFIVDPKANKIEIRKAIEDIFKVKVDKVRVVNMKGKPKRWGRFEGRRSSYKKAIVSLSQGHTIDFFEGE